jgi:putative IMPACT (imprinted ancient) family translation regulator
VIRYFGGTKLGVSGLINAYRETAKITLQNADIVENTIRNVYSVEFDYSLMNPVMQVLKNEIVTIKENGYNNTNALITFEVVRSYSEEITTQLKKIHGIAQKFFGTV